MENSNSEKEKESRIRSAASSGNENEPPHVYEATEKEFIGPGGVRGVRIEPLSQIEIIQEFPPGNGIGRRRLIRFHKAVPDLSATEDNIKAVHRFEVMQEERGGTDHWENIGAEIDLDEPPKKPRKGWKYLE